MVAMVLAWMGIGQARAQDYSNCNGTYPYAATCPDRPTAYAAAKASAQHLCDNTGQCLSVYFGGLSIDDGVYYNFNYRLGSGAATANGKMRYWASGCPSGQVWFDSLTACAVGCAARPDSIYTPSGNSYFPPNGAVGCDSGCPTATFANGDGTYTKKSGVISGTCNVLPDCAALGLTAGGYKFNAYQGTCEPPEVVCESNQVKGASGSCQDACPAGMHVDAQGQCKADAQECPAGNVKAPSGACLPGDGQCAAGEARRPNGTCGKDSDGDGTADDDDDNPDNDSEKETFSGGDNCSSPPSCSGNPIMCGQARIQWRIECNTRRDVNVSGGSCGAMPVCIGDNCKAMEYAQLLQQWKTGCELEKLNSKSGTGDGSQPEWTKVPGMNQNPALGQTADDLKGVQTKELDVDDLDTSGYGGGGGSCPALIGGATGGVYASAFATNLASPPAFWCTYVSVIYGIMGVLGACAACYILAKG